MSFHVLRSVGFNALVVVEQGFILHGLFRVRVERILMSGTGLPSRGRLEPTSAALARM